ncbi:VOC family protein [Bradyrhizobium hereditatis]|uniref:VOC family protein n=1 Tax=Bradyrhizobium hereditatis TaxID=2821405 RepID=UPI0035DC6C14
MALFRRHRHGASDGHAQAAGGHCGPWYRAEVRRYRRLDHIAFAATDVEGMRKRLRAKGVKFRESIVPRTGDTQFFLYDPDGVGVELNFPKT